MWCTPVLTKKMFPCFSGKPHIIGGHKQISVVQGECKTSFCNFSDCIGFTYLPDSCHQIAKCQPPHCRPMNFCYLKPTSHTQVSVFSCLFQIQSQMKCHHMSLVLASEKLIMVPDGTNQQCWGTTYGADFDHWEVRNERAKQINSLSLPHSNGKFSIMVLPCSLVKWVDLLNDLLRFLWRNSQHVTLHCLPSFSASHSFSLIPVVLDIVSLKEYIRTLSLSQVPFSKEHKSKNYIIQTALKLNVNMSSIQEKLCIPLPNYTHKNLLFYLKTN